MRWLLGLCLVMLPAVAAAQSRTVDPEDLTLTVTIENAEVTPYRQEMVLVTIHGVYRRHITRESLEQPDLSGFNWMQLGQDHWFESQLGGKTVKNFKRRMALYPDDTGTLKIGPFVHHLTLTDEGDDWFAHEVRTEPVTIEVAPAPNTDGWWFPVRRLEVSDQWSNAPDQLKDGEGVLRVVRITAVGVAPDMIPPMPELRSPSAMIFPHPEKRLVELSPQGPVSVAFWRWTIRPTNGASAILEPITFDYFDTSTRTSHQVKITAQRVAMVDTPLLSSGTQDSHETAIRPGLVIGAGVIAFVVGIATLLAGCVRNHTAGSGIRKLFNPARRALRKAARSGDLPRLRRAAVTILRQDGPDPVRAQLLRDLDGAVFGRESEKGYDTRRFARNFLRPHRIQT